MTPEQRRFLTQPSSHSQQTETCNLRLIAGRVGAGVLLAEIGKQKLVMTCALGAIDTASGCWHKLTVLLVERCHLEDEQDIVIDPELKIADGEEDALLFIVLR